MIQFHGGIGYTWEHDAHFFYKRAKRLAAAVGRAGAPRPHRRARRWRMTSVHPAHSAACRWTVRGMAARPVPVNATAAAILGLLHNGPMTGGELVAAAGERFGGFFSVTRSQVYRELPALAEAGLLRLGKLGARASQQYGSARRASARSGMAGRAPAGPTRCAARSSCACCTRMSCRPTTAPSWSHQPQRRTPTGSRRRRSRGAASDPCARAVAEFTVAHIEAVLTLLDAIPTAMEETA